MPVPWALRGLRNGVVTTRWPRHPDDYLASFRSGVDVSDDSSTATKVADLSEQSVLDRICPTGALRAPGEPGGQDGTITVDSGRCILCGHCVQAVPDVFRWRTGADSATLVRGRLVVPALPETDDEVRRVRAQLLARTRRLRRSVHIRHVDAGSDGSDEWEVQALLNPVYDIHRLGLFFSASPRHADILLVTGVGSVGMQEPLRRTREAMPEPVVVIASGADAISGGLVGRGYSDNGGVADLLDVDVWVPGSPASPFSLLHGMLLALGRVEERSAS